jgi:hypothetical protein
MPIAFHRKRIGMAKPPPQVFEKSGFSCFQKLWRPAFKRV